MSLTFVPAARLPGVEAVPFRTHTIGPSASGAGVSTVRPLLALEEVLQSRYRDLRAHGEAVARYSYITAAELGVAERRRERISLAGVLHDVGKVAVAESVLLKRGALDEREWREIQRHPEIGAHLLATTNLDDIARWVLAHHERPDGRGYPYGLTGDEIPLEAKIIAVTDAYDAMLTERVYSPALTPAAAELELRRGAGRQFDPVVVAAFLGALETWG